ncbi:DUF6518 family protein [Bacillus sp. B15-48]|uniref:DUF6518 family protein n=1 Tax=Bacillus sp. B15-48 TaxID=1548601 RepID=UPI0019400F32|nr:DUF6518 family protein [Bacillus sp. B15-48]MBM4764386.1 hypothetical protein [Bacillus sp. B15-48]
MSRTFFEGLRMMDKSKLTVKQISIHLCACLIFGVLSGIIAKFSDTVSSNGVIGMFFSFISDITTNLGIWVVLATIIAVWSRSPLYASLKVLMFFIGMLLAYYIYSQVLFGFFPTYYFLRWGIIALVSPLAGYIVWFSRGEGWLSAFCSGLPIGLLFAQGYPFFYLFSILEDGYSFFHYFSVYGFDIFLAIFLLVILTKSKVQYLRVVPMSMLIFLIIWNFDILTYIFGGL